jgi:hypothetical protein
MVNGRPPARTRKGSFWWRDIQKLIPTFKGMAIATVVSGSTCFFGLILGMVFLLALKCLNYSLLQRTNILQCSSSVSRQHLKIYFTYHSEEAYQQYNHLLNIVDSINLQIGSDSWTYIWNSGIFTSKRAYKQIMGHIQVHPALSWLWKSCCQNY